MTSVVLLLTYPANNPKILLFTIAYAENFQGFKLNILIGGRNVKYYSCVFAGK